MGFSLTTGQQIWGPTEPQAYLDYLSGLALRFSVYDGKLFSTAMSGTVYAYDIKTGQLLWTYDAVDPHNEILWGNNWPMKASFFAGGKLYLTHAEHSPIDPKPRGAPFIALDVETGQEVFRINGAFRGNDWGGQALIGDSIIAAMDSYDQQIYAIGKGPSATTVTMANSQSVIGSSIMITGTVTDISPGTKDSGLTMRFPNGIPAIADEYMSEWMLYVYKQFPKPSDAVGVPVTIDVIDSNGNYRNIGTTTTDASGAFSLSWKPDIDGDYTIIATFAGSKSYYPSYAQTAFVIDEAPETDAGEQPVATQSQTEMYIIASTIAIIAAIAIVGLLLLRKRP